MPDPEARQLIGQLQDQVAELELRLKSLETLLSTIAIEGGDVVFGPNPAYPETWVPKLTIGRFTVIGGDFVGDDLNSRGVIIDTTGTQPLTTGFVGYLRLVNSTVPRTLSISNYDRTAASVHRAGMISKPSGVDAPSTTHLHNYDDRTNPTFGLTDRVRQDILFTTGDAWRLESNMWSGGQEAVLALTSFGYVSSDWAKPITWPYSGKPPSAPSLYAGSIYWDNSLGHLNAINDRGESPDLMDGIFIGSHGGWGIQFGSPALGDYTPVGGASTTDFKSWLFDDAAIEHIAITIRVPKGASQVRSTSYWAMESATAGNIVLRTGWNSMAVRESAGNDQMFTGDVVTVPATAKEIFSFTRGGTLSVAGEDLMSVLIGRQGNAASDTAAGDAHFLGVLVEFFYP